MSNFSWTHERVDELKRLWALGWSASQIAKELRGLSRSAVIGKAHRIGLAGRSAEANKAATAINTRARQTPSAPRAGSLRPPVAPKPRLVVKANQQVFEDAPAFKPAAPLPGGRDEPGRATVLTLGAHMCKWPIGDPQEDSFTFCGKVRPEGQPYCVAHARRAVAAPRANRPKTANELARSIRRYLG